MPPPLKKCLMDINLQYMYQFVDNTGQFRKWNDIINSNPDYQRLELYYLGMISAIPKSWKLILKQNCNSNTEYNIIDYENMIICKLGCITPQNITSRKIYLSLVEERFEPPTSLKQWGKIMKIDNDQWNSYFNSIYCTTIDRYSREIQLKIMHRYLPVNKLLFKWNLIDSARCSYCFLYTESLDHIFYEC